MNTLLSIRGLVKQFGALRVTDHVDLDVCEGELHALIGPNGAGKTTLVNQISGLLKPSQGSIEFSGQEIGRLAPHQRAGLGLVRTFQITSVFPEFTALENVMLAVQARQRHRLGGWRDMRGDATLARPALDALDQVDLRDQADRPVAELAHGARRQLEMAMALATAPRMLLLDEPLAGMSTAESESLASLLDQLKGKVTMLLIEHDMNAVFALADRVSVLVAGHVVASGDPETVRHSPEVRAAYLGEDEEEAW